MAIVTCELADLDITDMVSLATAADYFAEQLAPAMDVTAFRDWIEEITEAELARRTHRPHELPARVKYGKWRDSYAVAVLVFSGIQLNCAHSPKAQQWLGTLIMELSSDIIQYATAASRN